MLHVIANIVLKDGCREEFMKVLNANVPVVLAENGCLGYEPCADLASGLGAQEPLNPNRITIVETWENLDCLRAHLQAPHMKAYSEKTAHLKVGTTLKVIEPVR